MKKALSTSMSSPRRFFWIMIFTMIILGGLLSLGIFLFTPDVASANEILPISLHSPLAADYSADPRGFLVPVVGLDVLEQIDQDRRSTGTAVPGDTLPTLVEILKTPVPTITPSFMAPQNSPTPRPTLTQPPQSSPTRPSTSTQGPSSTPQASATPSATSVTLTTSPTRTPVIKPSATKMTPAATSVQPSATLVPTKATKTLKPTDVSTTAVPPRPTHTPRPTEVPPTATSVPPTPVPPTPVPPTEPPPPTSYPPPPPPPTAYP